MRYFFVVVCFFVCILKVNAVDRSPLKKAPEKTTGTAGQVNQPKKGEVAKKLETNRKEFEESLERANVIAGAYLRRSRTNAGFLRGQAALMAWNNKQRRLFQLMQMQEEARLLAKEGGDSPRAAFQRQLFETFVVSGWYSGKAKNMEAFLEEEKKFLNWAREETKKFEDSQSQLENQKASWDRIKKLGNK